jgi:pimeloyl-ACP methyl ester carboxylesterase
VPYLSREDADIWWDEEGDGDAILLVNGLSSPSDTWFRLTRHLRPHFRVLTFDNRGVGRTGVPQGPYSVELMAADAAAVLAAADVASAHVLGLSMGGLIAQEMTLNEPDRVRSLILASTHVGIPHAVDADPSVAAILGRAAQLPTRERMVALEPLLYAEETPRAEIELDHEVRESRPTDESGYLNQLLGSSTWERLADLSRLGVPTLVLHGGADRLVPPMYARGLADAIPSARLEILEGAGHEIFTDREDDAARAVIKFLVDVSRSESVEIEAN